MRRHSTSMARHTVSELNITPLLDLVFVLLIIFMITTPLMEQSMQVNLPQARTQPVGPVDPDSIHEVVVDVKGRIFLGGQPVTAAQLEAQLKRIKARDADAAVALRADKTVRYQELVTVLDAIRESGVRLGLSTTPEK